MEYFSGLEAELYPFYSKLMAADVRELTNIKVIRVWLKRKGKN